MQHVWVRDEESPPVAQPVAFLVRGITIVHAHGVRESRAPAREPPQELLRGTGLVLCQRLGWHDEEDGSRLRREQDLERGYIVADALPRGRRGAHADVSRFVLQQTDSLRLVRVHVPDPNACQTLGDVLYDQAPHTPRAVFGPPRWDDSFVHDDGGAFAALAPGSAAPSQPLRFFQVFQELSRPHF